MLAAPIQPWHLVLSRRSSSHFAEADRAFCIVLVNRVFKVFGLFSFSSVLHHYLEATFLSIEAMHVIFRCIPCSSS